MNREKRFLRIFKEGCTTIWIDRETGVHYLFVQSGYGGGLTPLLGADGKPVIHKPEE